MVSNLKYLDIIEVKIKWSLPFKHWRYRTTIIYLLWFLIIPFLYFLSYGSRELDRGACTWWGLQPCNEDMDLSKFQEKGSKFKFFSHTDCEMNGSNSSFFFWELNANNSVMTGRFLVLFSESVNFTFSPMQTSTLPFVHENEFDLGVTRRFR
jgi:hypothetical protein